MFSQEILLDYGLWVMAILVTGGLAYWVARHWTHSLVVFLVKKVPTAQKHWKRTIKFFYQVILVLWALAIMAVVAMVVLPLLGVDTFGIAGILRDICVVLSMWLGTHGLRIAIVLGLGFVIQRILENLIPDTVERTIKARARQSKESKQELQKRADTLKHFLTKLAAITIWIIFGFIILSEIGVNIGPLLAGAGVVGIAVGFGAQTLIRDWLNGIFIIMENQYGKGDVIKVGDNFGVVEELHLRRTVLRDLDGARHIIPNGEIRVVCNFTQEWSRAHLDISVGYGEDLDRVMAVMKRVWEEMAQDANWAAFMISKTPSVLRVNKFGDSGIDVKIVGETQPLKQWDIMGEYRRRIKRIFDEEGIEIPWPHIKLYFGDDSTKPVPSKAGQSPSQTSGTIRSGLVVRDEDSSGDAPEA